MPTGGHSGPMGYYLLDHGQRVKWTAGNFLKVAVVMHCTAGLDIADEVRKAGGEWAGVDNSAERTYEWCASTTTASSWQSGSDWDSIIDGLPSGYIAWHVRSYNTHTIGHEISKTDMTWADEHEMWVGPTLRNAAIKVRQHCDQHNIPIRRIGKAQLDRAIAAKDPSMGGLTEHQLLDPGRRRDPGDDFPWGRFLDLVRDPTGDDMPTLDEVRAVVRAELQQAFGPDDRVAKANIGDWITDQPRSLGWMLRTIRKDLHRATGLLSALASDNDRILAAIADAEGLTVDEVRAVLSEAVAGLTVTFDDQEQP